MDLGGVKTAESLLGDYPAASGAAFAHCRWTSWQNRSRVGCNAGFHSIEMKRHGASRVVAIDSDAIYLSRRDSPRK
jgi:tRNA (mo5U34)-methyltransferase